MCPTAAAPLPAEAVPMRPNAKPVPPAAERRSGKDRRRVDLRLPGEPERRRSVEPRQPEVRELDLSESQWAELQAQAAPRKPVR